ncbi:hypothetical protein CI238_12723, partial [Colletotrichum incanum]
MDPLSVLRASYYVVLFGIELDQVPYEVKISLELVRTCHTDLQYLIELRNELLTLLTRRPKVLERVNNIIEAAHKGLAEVCEIVEKCRPQAKNGKTPLRSRISWILLDSARFRDQKAVVSRHHACVLAELNFLRQIALLAPATQGSLESKGCAKKPMQAFDNIALLGDLMGTVAISDTRTLPAMNPKKPSLLVSAVSNDIQADNALISHVFATPTSCGPPPAYPGSSHSATVPEAFEERKPPFGGPSQFVPTVHLENANEYPQAANETVALPIIANNGWIITAMVIGSYAVPSISLLGFFQLVC